MAILYGTSLCPYVRKVRLALAEKGIQYELQQILPMVDKPEWLLKINPLGTIPIYETEGTAIPDSSVIIAYLEHTATLPRLYPAEAADCAQALFLERYADSRLRQATGPFFYQNIVRQRFQKKQINVHELQDALPILEECFDYLESRLYRSPFIIGGELSVADIAIGAHLVTLQQGGEQIDSGRWPKLAGYSIRLLDRPSFQMLMEEEAGLLRGQD